MRLLLYSGYLSFLESQCTRLHLPNIPMYAMASAMGDSEAIPMHQLQDYRAAEFPCIKILLVQSHAYNICSAVNHIETSCNEAPCTNDCP
jgi:hypothetical protein